MAGNVKMKTKGVRTSTCESRSLDVNPSASHFGYYRTVDESRLRDFLCIAGWAELYRTKPDAARASAAAALERWISAGLQYRESGAGQRLFDPAETLNFAKALGLRDEDDFWERAYVATGRYLIDDATSRAASSRGFRVRLERHVNLAHYDAGARVRLHLPLPLEDASADEVRVVPITDGDVRIEPGRLVASVRVPPEKIASLAAEIDIACLPERSRGKAGVDDLDLYLRPREDLIEITPRIAALACELRGGTTDSAEAVRAFWTFFLERMMLGVVHYDSLPAQNTLDAVIDSGLFDCRLGTALLVALCRASGIPARMLGGYKLYAIPFDHFWAEVWRDDRGWQPLDLIFWDLSLRGRDAMWRERFFANLDGGLTTEIFPRVFTGFPSIRFPNAWHALSRPIDDGAAFGLFSVETGALVYEDRLAVKVNAAPVLP